MEEILGHVREQRRDPRSSSCLIRLDDVGSLGPAPAGLKRTDCVRSLVECGEACASGWGGVVNGDFDEVGGTSSATFVQPAGHLSSSGVFSRCGEHGCQQSGEALFQFGVAEFAVAGCASLVLGNDAVFA